MSKLNPKTKNVAPRLAGGEGAIAAHSTKEQQLRRMVMANLLWEDLAYIDGKSVSDSISALIPEVKAEVVAELAIEAREKQKLRHTPLFIAREMAHHDSHKHLVGELLPRLITRVDMLSDFVALYWKEGKAPLSNQVRKGLAKAFSRFDAYQLSKYDRASGVRLRDVLFLTRPKPVDSGQARLWKELADGNLTPPDTWEVALSSGADKKESWERLLQDGKLGSLAFLRNLRNMENVGVDRSLIRQGFRSIKSGMLLPLNFFAAAKHAPQWVREIDQMMIENYRSLPKLSGWTIFVVDVSRSMMSSLSSKSEFARLDAAIAMATLTVGRCEEITVYATAGSDWTRTHATAQIPAYQGFAMGEVIKQAASQLGGGGIFTRQCLEFIKQDQKGRVPDRIIVFSDSQDCDTSGLKPQPFGRKNYIVDVSAHQHGINHQGVWTSEISGWSEHFLTYIAAMEGFENQIEENAA